MLMNHPCCLQAVGTVAVDTIKRQYQRYIDDVSAALNTAKEAAVEDVSAHSQKYLQDTKAFLDANAQCQRRLQDLSNKCSKFPDVTNPRRVLDRAAEQNSLKTQLTKVTQRWAWALFPSKFKFIENFILLCSKF